MIGKDRVGGVGAVFQVYDFFACDKGIFARLSNYIAVEFGIVKSFGAKLIGSTGFNAFKLQLDLSFSIGVAPANVLMAAILQYAISGNVALGCV